MRQNRDGSASNTDGDEGGSGRRASLWLLAIPVLLIVAPLVLLRNYEVLTKTLAPGTDSTFIYRLRLFDVITLKAQPDVKPSLDVFAAYLLVVASTLAFGCALLLHLNGVARRRLQFFLLVGVGALWLGADELMGGHETIGTNLSFLADLPGVHNADDVVVAVYGLIAVAIVWSFRDMLREANNALWLFAAAVATMVVASGLDLVGARWLEEPSEVVAAMLGLLGFGALALHHLIAAGVVTVPQTD